MLTGPSRDIKFADFGLAKARGGSHGTPSGTQTRCGTPSYCAPEIALTGRYSNKVDIYALACSALHGMLRAAPDGSHEMRLVELDAAANQFPQLEQFVRAGMSLDPEQRPTAAQVPAMLLSASPGEHAMDAQLELRQLAPRQLVK